MIYISVIVAELARITVVKFNHGIAQHRFQYIEIICSLCSFIFFSLISDVEPDGTVELYRGIAPH
jgi:hypothetical protein